MQGSESDSNEVIFGISQGQNIVLTKHHYWLNLKYNTT